MIDWSLIIHVAAGVALGIGGLLVLVLFVWLAAAFVRGAHGATIKPIRVPRYGRNPDA